MKARGNDTAAPSTPIRPYFGRARTGFGHPCRSPVHPAGRTLVQSVQKAPPPHPHARDVKDQMRGFPVNLYERLEPLERLLDGLQNAERGSRASVQEEHVGIHAV